MSYNQKIDSSAAYKLNINRAQQQKVKPQESSTQKSQLASDAFVIHLSKQNNVNKNETQDEVKNAEVSNKIEKIQVDKNIPIQKKPSLLSINGKGGKLNLFA